jgi:hypothetical protein
MKNYLFAIIITFIFLCICLASVDSVRATNAASPEKINNIENKTTKMPKENVKLDSEDEKVKIREIIIKEFKFNEAHILDGKNVKYNLKDFDAYSINSRGHRNKLVIAETSGECPGCGYNVLGFMLMKDDFTPIPGSVVIRPLNNNCERDEKIEFHDLGCNGGVQFSFLADTSCSDLYYMSEYELYEIKDDKIENIFTQKLSLHEDHRASQTPKSDNIVNSMRFGKCGMFGYSSIYLRKSEWITLYKSPDFTKIMSSKSVNSDETWVYSNGKYRLKRNLAENIKFFMEKIMKIFMRTQ